MHNEIAQRRRLDAAGQPGFRHDPRRAFDRLNELADAIAESGNRQIDARLAELQRQTASTQRACSGNPRCWRRSR